MRSTLPIGAVLAITAAAVFTGGAAQAATPTAGVADKCAITASPEQLRPPAGPAPAADPTVDAATAQTKQLTDRRPEPSLGRDAAHDARKAQLAAQGNVARCAPGADRAANQQSNVIAWLKHYDQWNGFYCGPATVAEISATSPGPSPYDLNQDVAAQYMGTTGSTGTDVSRMVDGLNHFVGVPNFGFNFYHFVEMGYTPTGAQRSGFVDNVVTDVDVFSSPVAGDGWEAPGGPHLTGHPLDREIFHWFAIGGYDNYHAWTWYTDSATSVWSGVPAYSWIGTWELGTILGGRGYAW